MITDEDTTKIVNRIIEVQKDMFYNKPEMDEKFEKLREDFSTLQTSVGSFATSTKTNAEEIKAVNHRVSDHEDWIKKAGPKIKLEFKP